MKSKKLLAFLTIPFILSACSSETPQMPSNISSQEQVQSQSKNGLLSKMDFSLSRFKTNKPGESIDSINISIKPLLGSKQTENIFKYVSGGKILRGPLLVGEKNNKVYFIPQKSIISSDLDHSNYSLDKEFLAGQSYEFYIIGEKLSLTKENDYKIFKFFADYQIKAVESPKRKDYYLSKVNKEFEIIQGSSIVSGKIKISDLIKTK